VLDVGVVHERTGRVVGGVGAHALELGLVWVGGLAAGLGCGHRGEQSPTIAGLPVSSSGFSVDISSEQLDLLDADLIVAFPIYLDASEITDDPQWQAVPAVADGRAVILGSELQSAYSLGTVGAQQYALDNLVPLIEDALGS
jgi:hypothetical protein